MTDIEKEVIKDPKLLELIKKDFKKISKIKPDKIDKFIKKNKEELDKISKNRNWNIWLMNAKKKYKKLKKELEKDKFVLELDDGTEVYVDELSPESPKVDKEESEESDQGMGVGLPRKEEEQVEQSAEEEEFPLDDDPDRIRVVREEMVQREKERQEEEEEGGEEGEEEEGEEEGEEGEEEQDSSEEEVELIEVDRKSVSQHRKAFVNWVNKDLYDHIETLDKNSPLQIYQLLIREFLSLEMPYRGVLVYHGLGTGKTASAVSLAEGLSTELKINTILPASLETEFIKEVQQWGKNELNKKGLWKYYSDKDISENGMIEELEEKYNLGSKNRKRVMKNTQNYIRKQMMQEDPDTTKVAVKKMEKDIVKLSGVWIPDKTGKKLEVEEGEEENFNEYEKIYLEQQLNYLVHKKYNFIHYNPFPKVKSSSIKEFIEEDEEGDDEDDDLLLEPGENKKINTHNKKIVDTLEKKLKKNRRDHHVDSPFYKEVVIVDEVHNFVRQVLNDGLDLEENKKREAKRSRVFYEWIVNAEDIKLVFLSGTPVINKPCEIAILYNMLKGLIKIYSFSIKTEIGIEEATEKLNEFYYKDLSPIELFHVTQEEGKLVISFIQEKSNFKSLREGDNNVIYSVKTNDYSFNDFIMFIYKGLEEVFDKKEILPSKTTFKELNLTGIKKIKLGDPVIYDKELDLLFNKQQKLFDIYENGQIIDTTKHELFMSYFFENGDIVPEKKRILLKRMLMGLTSFYPIDRSSIVHMPQVVKPHIIDNKFTDYTIVKNLNIVTCAMSQIQYENYMKGWEWQKKIEDLKRGQNIWEEEIHHYNIRTRQACNVVFNDEENFRMMKKFKTDDKKVNEERNKEIERLKRVEYDKIKDNQLFKIDKSLNDYSPKFVQIYNNMQKFTKDKTPTGKILFYSDFRSDAGSEAFELMLQCNGYSKLNSENPPENKDLRYTFITGSESPEERRQNKLYFNDEKNIYGEYCQVMIISSAGAEGISLTCVRQVHILEPYWNYVRIDQVLGRAIRMRSHTGPSPKKGEDRKPWLPKEKQNVEQYLYISNLPNGLNPEEVYKSISKLDNWSIPDNWKLEDIKTELSKSANKDTLDLIESIIRINLTEGGQSADEYLFDVMEHKYKFSLQISDIIKESSLDCIKHTTDDPELNDRCIRFSDKLTGEIAYFPGIGAKVLEQTDIIQLKSKYIYRVKPDIYVISATSKDNDHNIYLYYEYKTDQKDVTKIDIRYLRENGKRLCDVYVDTNMILNYVDSTHSYNDKLDKEFSVYQEIYNIEDNIIQEYIEKDKFPDLDKLIKQEYLEGYKLKYNVNDSFFYMGRDIVLSDKCIQKIYPYSIYEEDPYSVYTEKPIIILDGELFIQD